uniref:Protein MAK10 homolog n=1 Tax=Rhabditophanes sp. KR3021 TaxID=114890 RepID=A0AC35TV27_9BILA
MITDPLPEPLLSKVTCNGTKEPDYTLDIKELFYAACKTLKQGEMVKNNIFDLHEAMSAIEMMEPSMDMGLVKVNPAKMGLQNAIKSKCLEVTKMDYRELVATIDATWGTLMSWLNLIPLDQSLKTNVLLHDPTLIQDQVLKSYVVAFLGLSNLVIDVAEVVGVFSEEDIYVSTYRKTNYKRTDVGCVIAEIKLAKLANAINETDDKDTVEGKQAVSYRIKMMEGLFWLMKTLLPLAENVSDAPLNFTDAKIHFTSFKSGIKGSECTIKYGLQPKDGNDSNYEWLPAFQPEVNRPIIPASFPKRLTCTSRIAAYQELKRIASKFEEIVYELEKLLVQRDQLILGTIDIKDLYVSSIATESCVGLYDENKKLYPVYSTVVDSQLETYMPMVRNVYISIIQNYTRNISRQMEFTKEVMSESENTAIYAHTIDKLINSKYGQEQDFTINGHFSTKIHDLHLDLGLEYIDLGFRTDVFESYEYDYIYYFLADILYNYKAKHIQTVLCLINNEIPNAKVDSMTPRELKRRSKVCLKKNLVEVRDKLDCGVKKYLYGMTCITRAYYILMMVLKKKGFIKDPLDKNEKFRFDARFGSLQFLIKHYSINYEQFQKQREEENKASSVDELLTVISHTLKTATTYITVASKNTDIISAESFDYLLLTIRKTQITANLLKTIDGTQVTMISNTLRSNLIRSKVILQKVLSSSGTTDFVPSNEVLTKTFTKPQTLLPYVDPILKEEDYFKLADIVTINELFKRRVHLGHKVGTVSENMKWALYGERLGVCVFDLDKTRDHFIKALNFLAHTAYRGGMVLFVSSDKTNMMHIEKVAAEIGQYSHTRKWQEGTLTNIRQLFGAPVRMPDVIVFTSTLTSVLETHPAVKEAAKLTIPTIAICDSNSDPNYITYPIPGNDDSPASVQYYMTLFREAIKRGQDQRKADQEKGKDFESLL